MNRCCEDCALADGYGDCGCRPKRHEGVWECNCWEPLPPEEDDDTEGEDDMTDPNWSLVLEELAAAKAKHKKFCDKLTDTRNVKWSDSEKAIKIRNNTRAYSAADDIIMEELAEAFSAVEAGDLAHARQELAQCAAVCVRAMEYIEKEMEKDNA